MGVAGEHLFLAEQHGDCVDRKAFLLVYIVFEGGGEVMEYAVIGFPPEGFVAGDEPGEFHVFATGCAVGFGEAADGEEELAFAKEVV